MTNEKYTYIKNANIFTPLSSNRWEATWQTASYSPGAALINEGRIEAIGSEKDVALFLPQIGTIDIIDAHGALVTPGFVDCHTHPVFDNLRANEFELRIKGASYVEIAKAGGGIRFSVRDLRKASKEQLVTRLLSRLDRFIEHGTTTIEAKSGYGLTVEDEIKSLEVLRAANAHHAVDIIPTFLGAHEIPDEFREKREAYTQLVIDEMLPRVAENGLAEFIDVFCEEHVFSEAESKRILFAGKEMGLKPKIHADQLHDTGGARVAAQVDAISADHLEHTPPELDQKLYDAQVVPVMLPGADFFLASEHYGPARRMISNGLPVALATDFNPGTCMSESMPMMLTIACLQLKMTPAEALTAATYHAAKAIGRDRESGTLEQGKLAAFVIWQTGSEAEIPSHCGVPLVPQVFKHGKPVYSK
jgi:imidazolonepropionase